MAVPQPSVVETAPVTTPGQPGSMNFVIENSKAFVGSFGLKINAGTFEGKFFNLTYPDTAEAAGLTLTFTLIGVPGGAVDLLGIGGGTTVGDFQIAVQPSVPAPGQKQLTVTITSVSLGAVNQQCELRAKVPGARQAWNLSLGQPGNNNFTLNYLACDPQALYTNPAPPPATPSGFEQAPITLTARGAGVGSIIGPTPPTGDEWKTFYVWSYAGNIAITEFPATTPPFPHTTEGNTYDVQLPGVYEPTPIQLQLATSFGNPDPLVAPPPFLDNRVSDADRPNLTIKAQPQHVALVLDKSGSMGEDGPPTRYDNAKLAAQMFTHLLAALREGVNPDGDRIGIVTFTDDGGWHQEPVSPKVKTTMALTPLEQAKADIIDPAKVDFGGPETNTPIGDGLVAGLDLLGTGSATTDRSLTLVLLTDGFENAGTVFVGPTNPSTPGNTIKPYKGPLTPARDALKQKLADTGRQFVIPLGAQVETQVLLELAGPNGFVPVTDPRNLATAFGDILHFSQEVNKLTPEIKPADPAVYLTVQANADRLILAALDAFPAGHSVRLESFDPGTGDWVGHSAPEVKTSGTTTFQVAWVPKLQTVPGVPTEWRITHLDGANAPVAMVAEQVLAYEDLHVKADVVLDKKEYQTGDDMNLTVRIRHDDRPILGAKVRAELIAPAVGTGEALSELGPDFTVGQRKGGRDVPPLMGEMIGEAMRRNKWSHWPHHEPKGLFKDGTNELHDTDNDGNYTNTFARVWKEGVYTWNLFVEGDDTNGKPFVRSLTVSTFASVKVSGKASKVKLEPIPHHPSKLKAVRVIVTPQDVRHERLGPGKDDELFWALKDGVFEHVRNGEPAPVFTDGTYQRVILFRRGQRPSVKVEAAGVLLPTIKIPQWILAL